MILVSFWTRNSLDGLAATWSEFLIHDTSVPNPKFACFAALSGANFGFERTLAES